MQTLSQPFDKDRKQFLPSPNQFFYNTKVDGEDNGPQRDGALRQPGRS
jgi:hypothetical protein